VDERGWLGFGRVRFLRMYREQPRCIRGPLMPTRPGPAPNEPNQPVDSL
jgi:hypothetical protein